MIRIFEQGDCMELMQKYADLLKSRKVLAIVDPPYGINIMGIWGNEKNGYRQYENKEWDYDIPDVAYFNQIREITKNQIIWGGNYFANLLPNSQGWIFWDKGQRNFTLADGELAWTSFDKALRVFDYSRAEANMAKEGFHPTEKPIALYKWLLEKYSAGHDLILDTHVGSASSLIACEDFGIDYIGFELDEDYYKKANERLLKARFEREAKKADVCVVSGLSLFEGE